MIISCVFLGSGPYEGLVTRSEGSYRVYVCVCDCEIVNYLEISTTRQPSPDVGCCVT